MKIAIFGVGVTGGALAKWFKNNTDHKLRLVDPALNHNDDPKNVDAAFICVPANNLPNGYQDQRNIRDCVEKTKTKNIFIRSTVLPGTNDFFRTYSMPEFLTERQAHADMEAQRTILTGFDNNDFLKELFPRKYFLIATNKECETIKYIHNSFAGLKVNFFNSIYELCSQLDLNYDSIRAGVLMSGLISENHTQVPGPDEKFGFGGKCLPKDTIAFIQYLKRIGQNKNWPTDILQKTIEQNNYFRNKNCVKKVYKGSV